MKWALLGLVACSAPAVVAPVPPPDVAKPPPVAAPPAPVDPQLAPLIAQIGPQLRAVARLDLQRDRKLNALFATMIPNDNPACHVAFGAARVAIGEPLRVAAEIDGDLDTARLTCVLGSYFFDYMFTRRGLVVSDRPGGIAITRDLEPGHADPALAQRCAGQSCYAIELGPAAHRVHVTGQTSAASTSFRIDGGRFDALVAAASADPALAGLELHLDPDGALAGKIGELDGKALGRQFAHLVETFDVHSSAMRPTLIEGDRLFAFRPPLAGDYRPGDLVILRVGETTNVKRVIAVGGQTVTDTATGLAVDGAPLPTQVIDPRVEYTGTDAQHHPVTRTPALVREAIGKRAYMTLRFGPPGEDGRWDVPAGAAFVVGDNRGFSNDSRRNGPLSLDNIRGRVVAIWFSWHDGAPDWNRMGTVPE